MTSNEDSKLHQIGISMNDWYSIFIAFNLCETIYNKYKDYYKDQLYYMVLQQTIVSTLVRNVFNVCHSQYLLRGSFFFSHVVGRRTIFQLETVRRCTKTETVGLRVILTGLSARHCNISFAATLCNLLRNSSYERTTLENSISILIHIILNLTFCISVAPCRSSSTLVWTERLAFFLFAAILCHVTAVKS